MSNALYDSFKSQLVSSSYTYDDDLDGRGPRNWDLRVLQPGDVMYICRQGHTDFRAPGVVTACGQCGAHLLRPTEPDGFSMMYRIFDDRIMAALRLGGWDSIKPLVEPWSEKLFLELTTCSTTGIYRIT